MARIFSKGEGAGSSLTNLSGKGFEEDIFQYLLDKVNEKYKVMDLKDSIDLTSTQYFYKIIGDDGTEKGAIGTQNALFKYLSVPSFFSEWTKATEIPEDIKLVWEKELIPDLFILNFEDPKKFITLLEVKYQNDSGSVDEKLQTGVFKKEMWNKLFRNLLDDGVNVGYEYILSNWFIQPSKKPTTDRPYYYSDTFEYLNRVKIPLYINRNIDYQDKEKDGVKIYKGKSKTQYAQMYKHNEIDLKGLIDSFAIDSYIK